MRSTSKLLLVGNLLLVGILAFTATAAERPPRDPMQPDKPQSREFVPPLQSMRVSLDVLVDGQPLRTVQHKGKTYLPVPHHGLPYEIRVSNNGPRRIAAMVSVDGLSVLNGQPARESHPGYIVDPYSSVVIKGWRRNLETVAAFTFEPRDESYASRMGHPENIGVIGLVAIEEKVWQPRPLAKEKDSAAPAAKRSQEAVVGGTGTGYGEDVESRVYFVSFVRSNNKRTVALYYDTAEALRKAGVPLDRPHPRPFPGDHKFAPPPPGDPRGE